MILTGFKLKEFFQEHGLIVSARLVKAKNLNWTALRVLDQYFYFYFYQFCDLHQSLMILSLWCAMPLINKFNKQVRAVVYKKKIYLISSHQVQEYLAWLSLITTNDQNLSSISGITLWDFGLRLWDASVQIFSPKWVSLRLKPYRLQKFQIWEPTTKLCCPQQDFFL